MSGQLSLDPNTNFAPIDREFTLSDLPVTGALPKGLDGTLFRNGPNPQFTPLDPARHHWFAGDGMIHAFTLCDGKASYRNRWVRTDKWRAEHAAGRSLIAGFGGPPALDIDIPRTGVANTNIVWHAGHLLALEEAHLPFEIDPLTLDTKGVWDHAAALHGPFTAHPKIDPKTNEMVFFGYSATGPLSPGMSYGTIGGDGRLTRFERFDAPYSSMVHDFAVTHRHVLFPIMPLSGSIQRAMSGRPPYAWDPDLGAYVGLLRRDQGVASLRWFRAENGYVFHVMNAWDDGDRVIVDVMQYDQAPLFPNADGSPANPVSKAAKLVRWTLDPAAGTDAFKRLVIDDATGEFPRLDDRWAGHANRFGAYVGRSCPDAAMDTVLWLDVTTGRRAGFTLPEGDAPSEAVFVPRSAQATEGDGWLLTVAWRAATRTSDLLILDTQDIEAGPVAMVRLPHRVPFGFHGNWVSAA